jgi:membrane protease YdiL (CAAX protease family)
LAVGVTLGYFVTNIVALLLGRTAFDHAWVITNPQRHLTLFCAVLVVPVAEELIYRGAILGSLLERTSIIWAVVITVTAAVLMHDVWWTALPSQILLCMAYLVRGRSLTASISAHMVANALIFAPALLIVFHKT